MRYEITHRTSYEYASTVSLSLNDACLLARSTPAQKVLHHQWVVDPQPDAVHDRVDYFGNHWRLFSFERPHETLELTSVHRVEVSRQAEPRAESLSKLAPFLFASPYCTLSPEFASYGRRSLSKERRFEVSVLELTERLFQDFTYDAEATTIDTPVSEFFQFRRGVCQDFAHLMVSMLRSLGIPARYVSGYLNTLPPPGKEKVWGADATHAWIEAYDTSQGWLAFDPTNGVRVQTNHITLAWGRDYGDVTPIRGIVLGGGTQKLTVEVTVARL